MPKVHEQITPETWCKHSFDKDDKHCAVGWIDKVYGASDFERPSCGNTPKGLTPEHIAILERCREYAKNKGFEYLTYFNDHPTIQFEDVLQMFKELDL